MKNCVIAAMSAFSLIINNPSKAQDESPCPPPKPCVLQASICGGGPTLCRLLHDVFGDVGADSGWKRDPKATACGSTIGGFFPRECGQPKIWDANCNP